MNQTEIRVNREFKEAVRERTLFNLKKRLFKNTLSEEKRVIMDERDCKCNDPNLINLFTATQICEWNKEENVDPDVLELGTHEIMVMVYWWIVFVLGLLVNSTVIFMILSNRSLMVTASHVYALHMAIADLLLILILPVHMLEYRTHPTWKWIKSWAMDSSESNSTMLAPASNNIEARQFPLLFGKAICPIYATIKSVNFVVSIYFLMLMAIDRYIAIHCNKYAIVPRNRPPKRAHLINSFILYFFSSFVWFMALIITFPIWSYTKFDTETFRCHEDWGMLNATIPQVPENERDLNDKMCMGSFHFSKSHTSNCNFSSIIHQSSNFSMRKTGENLPGIYDNGENEDYLDEIFDEMSESESNSEDFLPEPGVKITIDEKTFDPTAKRILDPFEWTEMVMNDARGGCKSEVNLTHESILFVKNWPKNCQMKLSNINECSCDTSSEFKQHTWLIFVFAFTVPIIVITYCYVQFLKSVYSVARSAGNTSQQSRDHAKEIKRLSFLVFCLIFAFLLCWGPAQLITVLKASGTLQNSSRRLCRGLLQSKNFLVWTSAVINSLIYMSMGGFRRRIKGSIKEFRESRSKTMESRLSRNDATPRTSFMPSQNGTEWNSLLARESNQPAVNGTTPLFKTTNMFENDTSPHS
ncbi:Oidioi.mRNA.OKI2018_I69.XSR.g16062.t1.cds [Oikopleura dioica]|uniref:Oidioi.mRNA.OKI2018_I69.XSR.g16062.t1.cds n=1 Tax=Oikopleura dioica TaxID=34765 RepID=A0ABN7SGR1_OIKDI|nr:Oidioi.mRNA.OKI2018_I69.XSR.g16062.t1.cds [Oikopleura dioica]